VSGGPVRFLLLTAVLTVAVSAVGVGLSLLLPALGLGRPWTEAASVAAMIAAVLVLTVILDRLFPRRRG
jgi:hypothetical protein